MSRWRSGRRTGGMITAIRSVCRSPVWTMRLQLKIAIRQLQLQGAMLRAIKDSSRQTRELDLTILLRARQKQSRTPRRRRWAPSSTRRASTRRTSSISAPVPRPCTPPSGRRSRAGAFLRGYPPFRRQLLSSLDPRILPNKIVIRPRLSRASSCPRRWCSPLLRPTRRSKQGSPHRL